MKKLTAFLLIPCLLTLSLAPAQSYSWADGRPPLQSPVFAAQALMPAMVATIFLGRARRFLRPLRTISGLAILARRTWMTMPLFSRRETRAFTWSAVLGLLFLGTAAAFQNGDAFNDDSFSEWINRMFDKTDDLINNITLLEFIGFVAVIAVVAALLDASFGLSKSLSKDAAPTSVDRPDAPAQTTSEEAVEEARDENPESDEEIDYLSQVAALENHTPKRVGSNSRADPGEMIEPPKEPEFAESIYPAAALVLDDPIVLALQKEWDDFSDEKQLGMTRNGVRLKISEEDLDEEEELVFKFSKLEKQGYFAFDLMVSVTVYGYEQIIRKYARNPQELQGVTREALEEVRPILWKIADREKIEATLTPDILSLLGRPATSNEELKARLFSYDCTFFQLVKKLKLLPHLGEIIIEEDGNVVEESSEEIPDKYNIVIRRRRGPHPNSTDASVEQGVVQSVAAAVEAARTAFAEIIPEHPEPVPFTPVSVQAAAPGPRQLIAAYSGVALYNALSVFEFLWHPEMTGRDLINLYRAVEQNALVKDISFEVEVSGLRVPR